jgi:uncharacterized membrane protein AbrB (regulator of aidB expression)
VSTTSSSTSQVPITVHKAVLTTHTTLNWPFIVLLVVTIALVVALGVYLWRRSRKNAEI